MSQSVLESFDGKDIDNHYFCYLINYGGKRRLVFCRVRQDVNKNRLYVHEVFLEDEIKSNALQTAAHASESQKPHGGIALYQSILQSVYAVNPASVSKVVVWIAEVNANRGCNYFCTQRLITNTIIHICQSRIDNRALITNNEKTTRQST